MRILVADDDPSVRDLITLQLELEGHEVSKVSDGESAMAALALQLPDAMVLDVMMPKLNGWDVLERLRADERCRRLPVVLLTAKDLPHDRQRARDLGVAALVSKPHDAQHLLDVLAAVSVTRTAS